jgi:hypothetical protein
MTIIVREQDELGLHFVHHHLSASFGADPPLREKLIRKNKKIYESRWGKWVPHRYRKQEGYGE